MFNVNRTTFSKDLVLILFFGFIQYGGGGGGKGWLGGKKYKKFTVNAKNIASLWAGATTEPENVK
jgi:hypothetical protein